MKQKTSTLLISMKPDWTVNACVLGRYAGYLRDEMPATFCVAGPGIAHGYFASARIVDVAPTILKLVGEYPAPENFDGKPIPEVVR
jgi:hypothetical protein